MKCYTYSGDQNYRLSLYLLPVLSTYIVPEIGPRHFRYYSQKFTDQAAQFGMTTSESLHVIGLDRMIFRNSESCPRIFNFSLDGSKSENTG